MLRKNTLIFRKHGRIIKVPLVLLPETGHASGVPTVRSFSQVGKLKEAFKIVIEFYYYQR